MTLVNHLREKDGQNLFHAQAYGKHFVTGNLVKSIVTGSSPTHVIQLQQMLGRGEWDGCEGLWWKGVEVKPDKYKFHPGAQSPTPVLKTYTADNSTNVITSTAHGYNDGDQVVLMPGSLPAPLTDRTVFYVRDKTTDTFKLAATSGGSAIDITTNGSGTLKVYKNDPDLGIDEVFPTDTPHSGVAWIRAELASGMGDFDTKASPPEGLKGIFRTTKCTDYDSSGSAIDYLFSTNPALQVADLIIRLGNRPVSRIDWSAWCDWRDYLAELIAFDYRLLTDFDGIGLTGSFYNGTAFDTLISQRIDPVLFLASTAGSPGVGVDDDNFSVRWEGFIKSQFSETYTIYVTHTHGAKVYVNDMTTPLIDEWSSTGTHSQTIALTLGNFNQIKVEWKHTTGNAEFKLEWESTSQSREVISHRALYPKVANRPRYETHPFFAGPTRLDDAVRTILNLCNSTVQEVDGTLRFFCLEQLLGASFAFTDDNTLDAVIKPRDVRNLRNTWQAQFRDIDSQYFERPIDPMLMERPTLIDIAGRKIDGEAIELFNCSHHQAYRTLDNIVRRSVDSKFQLELTGNADTFPVLAGDRVAADVEFTDAAALDCLVLESNDSSSEETADERIFVLQEWPWPCPDEAHDFIEAAVLTDPTHHASICRLVADLKAAGLWTKFKAVYPLVGGTAATHKWNLKDPRDLDAAFRIVWNGSVTHDANGITGDGGGSYGDTKLNALAELSANNTHLSVYNRSAGGGAGIQEWDLIADNGVSGTYLVIRNQDNFLNWTSYTTGGPGGPIRVLVSQGTDGRGFFVGTRRSSTDMEAYKNGASIGSSSDANTATLPNITFKINGNGNPFNSDHNLAFASIGTGLTSAEVAAFDTIVQRFETLLGRAV